MRAGLCRAVGVQAERVVGNGKTLGSGHGVLALLDFGVVKLLHLSAVKAHQMIVVLALIEFKDCLAALEMAATKDLGVFKLRQSPVDGGQSDIGARFQQHPIDIFGRHVAAPMALENFQYFQPRQGCLQSGAFEFIDSGHGSLSLAGRQCAAAGTAGTMQRSYRYPSAHPMIDLYRRSVHLMMLLASSAGLLACGSLDNASNRIVGVVTPYKVDIVQGNFVSKEQSALLKPGVTRAQVRDILGTPLLMSLFHADRWDYVFTIQRQGLPSQLRKLTVTFKGDELDRIDAEPMPSEADFVASLDSARPAGKVPVLELSEESLKLLPVPAKKVDAKPLPTLPTNYPPLEPATR